MGQPLSDIKLMSESEALSLIADLRHAATTYKTRSNSAKMKHWTRTMKAAAELERAYIRLGIIKPSTVCTNNNIQTCTAFVRKELV